MKGKLLIEPGFEAGSEFCGRCFAVVDHSCCVFDIKQPYGGKSYPRRYLIRLSGQNRPNGDYDYLRCQACLDAEQKPTQGREIKISLKPLMLPPKTTAHEVGIKLKEYLTNHDKMDHFPYECWTECKICNPTGKRPQSVQ